MNINLAGVYITGRKRERLVKDRRSIVAEGRSQRWSVLPVWATRRLVVAERSEEPVIVGSK